MSAEERARVQPELDKLDAEVEKLRAEQKKAGLNIRHTAVPPGEAPEDRRPKKQ